MKKVILFITLILGVLFYPSCSNDIDLVDEWEDIPIVYGLLSPSQSVNYIRVEKAFLDNEQSAFTIAQNPDSLYYDDITVQVSGAGVAYDLVRVDGNLEGFPREEGIFANAPNYLYKLDLPAGQSLEDGQLYSLKINRGDDLPLVTAQAEMVDSILIREPNPDPLDEDPIRWVDAGLKVEWRTEATAKIFDVWVYMHIEEEDLSDPANTRIVTLDWKIEENLIQDVAGNGIVRMDTRLTKLDLFNYLANNLESNPNIIRRIVSFDLEVIGGGEGLADYISTGNANSGITSTQVIPTFTNLSEGRGIFSSKNSTFQEGYTINSVTIDSMRNNNITKNLNFQF